MRIIIKMGGCCNSERPKDNAYVFPTEQAKKVPNSAQGWKFSTQVQQSSIPNAGKGRFILQDIPEVGTVVNEKKAIKFSDITSLQNPADGCFIFVSAEEVEKYSDLHVEQGATKKDTLEFIENFVAAYNGEHCMVNVNSWNCNHMPKDGEANIKVSISEDGDKYQLTTLTPIKAGEEMFMDYSEILYPDWYIQDFCAKNSIADIRTNLFAALEAAEQEDADTGLYGKKAQPHKN